VQQFPAVLHKKVNSASWLVAYQSGKKFDPRQGYPPGCLDAFEVVGIRRARAFKTSK
jgi:hypothetical protein